MSTPQWVPTLSLALEIPFDSSEDSLWSALFTKHQRFTEIFITTLTTIDIVRLPFIDYSFIKWFTHQNDPTKEPIFMNIQAHFQAQIRRRVNQELLSLQESDKDRFLENLTKLGQKVNNLKTKHQSLNSLTTIASFLLDLDKEIKELEEKGLPGEEEEES